MDNYNSNKLKESLLRKGFYQFKNPYTKDELTEFFRSAYSRMSNKNFLADDEEVINFFDKNNILKELKKDLYDLASNYFNYNGSKMNEYYVARKVDPGDKSECYRAHFDSHIFTIVLPVKIPNKLVNGNVGELIFFPKIRNFPKSSMSDLFGKIWFKRFAGKRQLEALSERKQFVEIDFNDLNPLVFIGNTTLHTNKEVSADANTPRMTILGHFFDPFEGKSVGSFLRKIRER